MVIGIIGVLLALIVPALGGAMRRGYKTRELNDLKNIGHAWMLYANSNNDAALPGYLDPDVQAEPVAGVSVGWGVSYKLPNGTAVQPTSTNLTGPWTWRLLSYLSFDHRLIHPHLDEPQQDLETLVSEGVKVAYEPAYGYNGYYIGGWYQMRKVNGIDIPFPRYFDHCAVEMHKRAMNIPTTVAQIARSSEMVTFCSSSLFETAGEYRRVIDETPGYYMVMPPSMELAERWRPAAGNPAGAMTIVQTRTSAPIARYTNSIAVLGADGHVDQQGYNDLYDMRRWVNNAETAKFQHQPCNPQ